MGKKEDTYDFTKPKNQDIKADEHGQKNKNRALFISYDTNKPGKKGKHTGCSCKQQLSFPIKELKRLSELVPDSERILFRLAKR